MKLRIRGPHIPPQLKSFHGAALWLCYDPDRPDLSVAAISPMIAYRTWQSIYGKKP